MNFFKAFLSWKVWFSILLGVGLIIGLWFYSFKFLDNYTEHGVEIEVPDISGLDVREAVALLEEKGLSYEVDSLRFTDDFPPYAILTYYPKAGFNVKPGRRIYIKSNPHAWAPVELPNLIGKSKRLADTKLKMFGFTIGDTIYVKDRARDAVLAIIYNGDTISSGTLLPKGAKLDMVLGRGLRLDVPVPDLIGLSEQQAKNLILRNSFVLGGVHYLDTRDSITTRVVYQNPSYRDIYDEGLPVSIWLSSKSRYQIKNIIDSLDIKFRHVIDEDDNSSNQITKPEPTFSDNDDYKKGIRFDESSANANTYKKERNSQKNKIDTTGISID